MTTTAAGKRFEPFTTFLTLACVGLAILTTLLARENRSLKARLAADSHLALEQADALKPGDLVKPFPVLDGAGQESTIGFGEGEAGTILLVFSSTCPACQETIPRWTAVLGSVPRGAVRIVAVQTDRADPHTNAAAHVLPALPFPIYSPAGSGAEVLKKVPFIPATVILDAKGVVTQAWFGVPTEEQEEALLRALKS
jgi:peroxiredoxin